MRYKSIILVLFLILTACSKKEAVDTIVTINSFFGEVAITSNEGNKAPAVGQILSINDTIVTGANSVIDLVYRNSGIIRINENTTVVISSLVKAGADDVVLTLEKGKAFVTLGKLKKGDGFAIKAKTVIAAVRGTSFRLVADEEASRVDVVSGKVMVKPVNNETVIEDIEVIVEENQTVTLDTKTVATISQKIDESKVEVVAEQEQQKIIDSIKETIKPVEIPKETVKEIKQEVKDIPVITTVQEEIKQEIQKVIETDKEAKQHENEEKLKKAEEAKALKLKLKNEQEAKILAEKLAKEKAEQEKVEKAKAEQEKAAKEQKIKEDRVKNIPTL
ncbi:MAG TPA: FecR domain-containing protein [Spirochaetota bacterium]|nr:FecR domain-containing protein [Spirochaetota bacterium]